MSNTVFLIGGTGQTGGNVCKQLIERSDDVKALVRKPEEASELADLGAEAAATQVRRPRTNDNPTTRELGYDPMSLDDGLNLLIPWLRELGRLAPTGR